MLKHNKDTSFKLNNKTTVFAAKALTKQDNTPLPFSISNKPAKTLNNNVSQKDHSLAKTDQVRLARFKQKILKLGWKK
jgi:hypothetical protein